jgi:hypothetical protein
MLTVALLLPSLSLAEDGPMSELATGETYGQCIGVPPICMYPITRCACAKGFRSIAHGCAATRRRCITVCPTATIATPPSITRQPELDD